jgi:hypothetical protein
VLCHSLLAVMDPITVGGLALSVVGLVPLCASGFQFVENIISAPKAAAKAVDLIAFQSTVSGYSIS